MRAPPIRPYPRSSRDAHTRHSARNDTSPPRFLRQGEILRDAVPERPVAAGVLDERDEHVLGARIRSLGYPRRDERVELLLLLGRAAHAEEHLHDDDRVGAVDLEVCRIVDESAAAMLGEYLKAI